MAYLTRGDDGYQPLPFSQSQWSPDSINGSALAGLTAHAVESACSAPEYRPAKFTLDIFRQPTFSPLQTDTTVVREGRSIRIADVVVRQGERVVARASMVSTQAVINTRTNSRRNLTARTAGRRQGHSAARGEGTQQPGHDARTPTRTGRAAEATRPRHRTLTSR
ncbi:hypothetical protein B2J88_51720 [Rhodococcus sp. SRB_17]|nr:hypothetical protein [Rhodococcus sp. SRB_17]